jgi:hypothetical protein
MNFQRYVAKISGCKISDREFYRLKATMKDFGLDATKENYFCVANLKRLSVTHKISLSKCLGFYLSISPKLPCNLSKKDLRAICLQIAPNASLASIYRWCEATDKKSVSIAILLAFNYRLSQRKKLR